MLPLLARQYPLPTISGHLLVPVIFATSTMGSLLPPGSFRTIFVTSTLAYLVLAALISTTGDKTQDEFLGLQAMLLFMQWIYFYVLRMPENEFVRDKDQRVKEGRKARSVNDLIWWEKLYWVVEMKTTLRGINWNWKVKNVPTELPQTKWLFIRTQLIKTLLFYFAFDIILTTIQSSVYGSPTQPPLFSDTILRQVYFSWLAGMSSYFALNMQYPLFAAITVLFNVNEPRDWPPLMGKLRDVKSVRGFWGRFWHQNLRTILYIPFEILSKAIDIPKGSLSSQYSQLYLAFLASAFLHQFPSFRRGEFIGPNLIYFLIQPLAITLEDFVIHIGKRAGIVESRYTRLLGRIWTFSWFSFALRYGARHLYESGFFEVQHVPSSVKLLIRNFEQD